MTAEIDVSREVRELVGEIIAKNDLKGESTVTYDVGSEAGDGYLSKGVAVTIKDAKRTIEIFMKCGLDIVSSAFLPIDRYYANEIHFYEKIYPVYADFLREKKITDGEAFTNVARCYATSGKKIIALDNLKKRGYRLCDKTKPLDDDHISLVFLTFAKFHAISFALKDQKREVYDELIAPTLEPFEEFTDTNLEESSKDNIREMLASLDPVKDREVLDATVNLPDDLIEYGKVAFFNAERTDYDILTQGDCWCNNIMFLYKDKNSKVPIEALLIDWQLIRTCSPIYDLSYFFYTIASEEAMADFERYQRLYYDELSRQMKLLGSDPEVLFPFTVLQAHWKQHAKYGLYMGFMLIRLMLSEKDEQMNLEEIDFNGDPNFFNKIKNNDEYFRRMKVLIEHMVKNGFI